MTLWEERDVTFLSALRPRAPPKDECIIPRSGVVNGRAKPSRIVSHHINIDEAPEAYEKFDQRIDGYTKILIRFAEKDAA